eukprot:CAMPEP_0202693594 /NCGR_PEP_ID=MMETSP1385-20130828/7656_1 /ASSEMBLY_ACC=CAM_ASM_000861 /TAXON_ID=933848 /ORGANISM="Elphidium margaritaceum" /LENGTH=639 /DNA_ID=CAMNT_0049349291 /DNA_START=43 /DNA_END=1959 /DNA_ORIENTATION=+
MASTVSVDDNNEHDPDDEKKQPALQPGHDTDGDDKESKRARNRIRAINELITTEQTYCDNLDLLLSLFVRPLQERKLISAHDSQTIFSDIETIIQLNKHFLGTLKTSDEIGSAMMEFAPYFKMYSSYINNHEKASSSLMRLTQNPRNKLSRFLQQQYMQHSGGTLQSYLILPIQRIPRYELCLKEIIKLTPSGHADLDNLQTCYEAICAVNQSINEQVREFEAREKVRSIEQRFEDKISLVTPSRIFIREGLMTKICRKKDVKYVFILLSDLLLYGEQKEKAIKLHNLIEIDVFFRVQKLEHNRLYGDKCFEIYSTRKSFLCLCDNEQERDEWYEAIKHIVDGEQDKRNNRNVTELEIRSQEEFVRVLDVAPIWIPDGFTDVCMLRECGKKFTVMRRRHHCRYCGKVVCGACSAKKLPHFLPERMHEIVRVCNECHTEHSHQFPDFAEEQVGGRDIDRQSTVTSMASMEFEDDDDREDVELDEDLRQRFFIAYVADENDEVVPDEDYYREVSPGGQNGQAQTHHTELTVVRVTSVEVDSDLDAGAGAGAGEQKEQSKEKAKKKKEEEFMVSAAQMEKEVQQTYKAGAVIRIHSLQNETKYNGEFARVIGFIAPREDDHGDAPKSAKTSSVIEMYRVRLW